MRTWAPSTIHSVAARRGEPHTLRLPATVSVAIGPCIDSYGPKTSMAALLLVGAVPFFFAPLVQGWRGMIVLR